MRIAFSALAFLLLTAPGFAAVAVTYEGTLGGMPIVAEITQPEDGPVVGRYFYRKVGADIPLDAKATDGNSFTLSEEAMCQPGTCKPGGDDGYTVLDPPIGATWSLTLSDDGQSLSGTWVATGKSKQLPIALKRVAERELPTDTVIDAYFLHDSASMAASDPRQNFTAAALPYDFLKLDASYESPVEIMGGNSYRYVTDMRTKFPFPRVVALDDGSDPAVINTTLAVEQLRMNIAAFDCLSTGYAAYGWSDDMGEAPVNSLGDYDAEAVQVTYLSPKVISWNEAGSLYCVAAHPDNHSNSFNYDVRTGQPLDLSKVLKGWVTRAYGDDETVPTPEQIAADPSSYHGVADASLTGWVWSQVKDNSSAAAGEPTGDQTESDEECGLEELVDDYLAVRFQPGDEILFTLEGLPNVIFACAQDLMTVPLADIPDLLAPTAKDYFPSLAQ